MHDSADKKRLKVEEIIKPENIIKVSSLFVQALLILGLILVMIYTINSILQEIKLGTLEVATEILINSLLIIVFFELYLSAVDFFRGKGRSVIYIMDATISFLLREIIIEILSHSSSIYYIVGLGGIIGIISLARYVIGKRVEGELEKEK